MGLIRGSFSFSNPTRPDLEQLEVSALADSGAVLTLVRPSAKELLELRDALLQEPGFKQELDAFFEGLHDSRPAEPVDVP
jgi:antitoxin VapB